ncbi:MAG: type I-D CRISPR-associated helicase Cas3' [Anaerolineae bacterium]|nr:type I-D CRISPR-associated helicase Cas3' [Anaerolineae bacterium]
MHTIRLQAVDSRYATDDELKEAGITPDQIPIGSNGEKWCMMAHQTATIKALRYGDAPIIINQAMTGDGKSLAGQFTLFADRWNTFTMYPTNELAADQSASLAQLQKHWQPSAWQNTLPVTTVVNADVLDRVMDNADGYNLRADALKWLLDSELLLTNPDIFHLMVSFHYVKHGAANDLLLGELAHRYRLFVFDEFHVFGIPQVVSVMMAVLLLNAIQKPTKPARFLFLSATSQGLLAELATNVGLKVQDIHGVYEHGRPTTQAGYRRILREVNLSLYEALGNQLETWVDEHLEDVILRFFREQGAGAKGVIIANSIATAHRIHEKLRTYFEKANIRDIQLGLNTGIVPQGERSRKFDLLVATSTIDVGVDFRINLLIYESLDAATHIQRLGRLGRHTDDGAGNAFQTYEAHALLPPWVVEGLVSHFPDGSSIDRDSYKQRLEQYYLPLQAFQSYMYRWAGVQSTHILRELKKVPLQQQYEPYREKLFNSYTKVFGGGNKLASLKNEKKDAILDAAHTFRGGSPFNILVLNPGSSYFISYNLVSLLYSAELEPVELDAAYEQSARNGKSRKSLERSHPLGAFKLIRWLPKRREVSIYGDWDVESADIEQVIERRGFRFDVTPAPNGINQLNIEMEARPLAAYLIRDRKPDELRPMLKLGMQIDLFSFHSANEVKGSICFHRDALLLDSIWHGRKPKKPSDPYIC